MSSLSNGSTINELLDLVGDGFLQLDKDWKIQKVNHFYETVTNINKKDSIGKVFWELFPQNADPQSIIWIQYHKVMRDRKPVRFVNYSKAAHFYTEVDVYPNKDRGILIFFRDITARITAENQLKQQAEISQIITNHVSVALCMVDTNGHLTYMNPVAERVTGYSVKHAMGLSLHNLIHHSHADGTPYDENDCPLMQTYKHGINHAVHEDIFFRQDGTPFPVIINAIPIIDDGHLTHTVIDFRDLSEEKRALANAKKALRRQSQLEKAAAVLRRQREELIMLNVAKDEFINLASHQLRTPATAVKQYLEMLLEGFAGELTPAQIEFLQTADNANERQLRIIESLLKVARVDSGKLVLEKQKIDVVELLNEIIAEQALSVGKDRVVTVSHPKPQVHAHVDRDLFRMVIENLLDNAHKYGEPGKDIRVTIDPTKQTLGISITNDGPMIEMDDINKLFKKFSRLDNAISIRTPGTGLGLYVSKRVIDLHDGTINVVSQRSEGTTFTVSVAT